MWSRQVEKDVERLLSVKKYKYSFTPFMYHCMTPSGSWNFISQNEERLPGMFFNASEAKKERLKRFTIGVEDQEDFESEKLWAKVSDAIRLQDQVGF